MTYEVFELVKRKVFECVYLPAGTASCLPASGTSADPDGRPEVMEMLSHEFLPVADENGGKAFAARTVFSDGTEVVANCSDESLTFGELILAPHSFHIGKKTS